MKPLPTAALVIVSLVFAANGALAGQTHPRTAAHPTHVSRTHAVVHAPRKHVARVRPRVDPARLIQTLLGGGWPAFYGQMIHLARTAPAHGHTGASAYTPTYESPPAADFSSAGREAQEASDAENQAIQQMNDTNALNASMAAAEQQNDAANAATLQTELNANF